MGLLKLCQGRVAELPSFESGLSHSGGFVDTSLREDLQASLTSAWLSARKGLPKFHTQFLDTPTQSSSNCRSDVGLRFLCGPQAALSASHHGINAHPTAFAQKNTVHLRLELPPGFNVDRVTQLPLFEDGKVEAGHTIGRDINVSIANENSYFHRHREKAGLQHPDQEDDRLVVRGDEWPSEVKAKRQARAELKASQEKLRKQQALLAQAEQDSDARGAKFDRASPTTHAWSSAASDKIRAKPHHANYGEDVGRSALERRVAALEADNRKKEEQLNTMLAQVQERMNLPRGQQPSSCCQCGGVVTYAPHGHCSCPYGSAESRAAPAGCHASLETSYQGMKACASACQEVFRGHARPKQRVEDIALSPKVVAARSVAADKANVPPPPAPHVVQRQARWFSEKDLPHGQNQKHTQAWHRTAAKEQAIKPKATGSQRQGQAQVKALEEDMI